MTLFLVGGLRAQESDFYEGVVSFRADYSDVFLPYGVTKVFFDTLECKECKEKLPPWRFIGHLKVDSLVRWGVVEPLERESQMDGIRIGPQALLYCMVQDRIYCLQRRASNAIPYDTLVWSSVRKRYCQVPDLSVYFKVRFSEHRSLDTVVNHLRSVNGLRAVQAIPQPVSDGVCSDFLKWTPNAPKFVYNPAADSLWYLREKDYVTHSGGVNAECTWGLLANNSRGGVTAVIELDGVRFRHPDLYANHCCLNPLLGDTTVDAAGDTAHGTLVTGVVAAVGNNALGSVGVAPDGAFICYNGSDETDPTDDVSRAVNDASAMSGGASVICIAWHSSDPDSFLLPEMQRAKSCGCVVVCSAGDYKVNKPFPYTSYPSLWTDLCISVASHGMYGGWDPTSNYACPDCSPSIPPFVDVAAPGISLGSTTPAAGYGVISGTSAACAVVAGTVSLATKVTPEITPEVVESLLRSTADPGGWGFDTLKMGAGRIDAYKFMQKVIAYHTGDELTHEISNASEAMKELSERRMGEAERMVHFSGSAPPVADPHEASTSIVPTATTGKARSNDSIPCLIVTTTPLYNAWAPLAQAKRIRGSKTAIVTEWDWQKYPGLDDQEEIRSCIKAYHDLYHTEWIILGGDVSVIPCRYVRNNIRGEVDFVSDYYYACLDGTWDEDGDRIFGEIEDDVDLTAEVAVGRVPVSTPQEVADFISKLNAYESGPRFDWQNNALFVGSKMWMYADGKYMSKDLIDYLSKGMVVSEMYDDTGGTASKAHFFEEMNAGKGLVVLHGVAQHDSNFFLHRWDSWDILWKSDIDTLSNDGTPSVVYSSTCWNNQIDHDCIAKHYMKHPTGGAVAYIGSTYGDYVYESHPARKEFFSQLFGSGPKQIGELLNLGNDPLLRYAMYEGGDRHTVMSYLLLGDPQMCIWTEVPKQLTITAPDWLPWGVGPQSFDITVSSSGCPLPGAAVCVSHASDIYRVSTTDSSGVAHFTDVAVPDGSTGNALVLATKANYITADTIMRFAHCAIAGDADDNCSFDIGDPAYLITYIFEYGPPPPVMNRGDANGDSTIDISDATYMVQAIFVPGSPQPVPGCVTDPHGGNMVVSEEDPNDREDPHKELAQTDEVVLLVSQGTPSDFRIEIDSKRNIHALSVTLKADPGERIQVESLLRGSEAVELHWSQVGTLVKIGLIDIEGRKFIEPGQKEILRVTGNFEIAYSLAVEASPTGVTTLMRPRFSNLADLVREYSFAPNYPNPFNPATSFSFAIPRQSHVTLHVYNILGQTISSVVDEVLPPGRYHKTWNGVDARGQAVASGVYFARLRAGDFNATRKMLILK